MSQPYVGEIRLVGFTFAPVGWALCNGQSLPISQNEVLFNLIGTTYGGDGQTTFNLPNLQSRIPFHMGANGMGDNFIIGQSGGTESVTLTTSQIPPHSHTLAANTGNGNQPSPSAGVWAGSSLDQYSDGSPVDAMSPNATTNTGGNLPHDNVSPILVINFVISLFGIYPSQS
jgi:microcystin-dependent protein